MTKKEVEMLKNAIDTHISTLYRDAEAYRQTNNVEAQKDCFSEVRKYRELMDKLNTLIDPIFSEKVAKEIEDDAVDAIRMSGNDIDFDEWYPAWMIDGQGKLTDNPEMKEALKTIWDKAYKSCNYKK